MNCFQAQVSQLEHCHAQRLLEVTARHHQELDLEMDRLRDSQLQAEQALESREKAHRQRVKCLEEQVFEFRVWRQVYVCVCVSVYLPNIFSLSLFFTVADSERAAGSGDKKTTGLFQSDATTWCVGREPAVTYVAPLASSSTAPLAASQRLYVTSYVHVWKHT